MIAILKGAIGQSILLNCVVCEMDVGVVAIIHVVLCTRGTKIALLEKEALHLLSDENPHADVKLPLVDEQGPLYVFLYYEVESFRQDNVVHPRLVVAGVRPCFVLNDWVV